MIVERNGVKELDDELICTIKKIIENQPHEDYFLKKNIVYKFVKGNELLVVPEKMQ